ncbi:MAG: Fur family transcriptional regulator [Lachnospiraceae bacterium]|nr:Fur family transcriptional regulator [Lachnospiraceae bacterium]
MKFYKNESFQTINKKSDLILSELRKNGCRITEQRKLIIDIILENECSCCKEIYYQAAHKDPSIGIATVYRMLKKLEEIGAIDRKNQYQISYDVAERPGKMVVVEKNKVFEVKELSLFEEIVEKLKKEGYISHPNISIVVNVNS